MSGVIVCCHIQEFSTPELTWLW